MEITKELLISELIENSLSIKELSNKIGIPRYIITSRIKKFNLSLDVKKSRENKIVGNKYNMLTVLSYSHSDEIGRLYTCKCDCGNTVTRRASAICTELLSCGCMKNKHTTWSGVGELSKTYFSHVMYGAKKRNIDFNLSIEYIWELFLKQDRKCALSGSHIYLYRNKAKDKATASLDRKDSTKGYIEGNVQWIHKDIQMMKWDKNESDFIEWCEKIYKYKITD